MNIKLPIQYYIVNEQLIKKIIKNIVIGFIYEDRSGFVAEFTWPATDGARAVLWCSGILQTY